MVIIGLILQIYHKTTKFINQHLRGCKTCDILLKISRLTQNQRFYITLSFTDHDFLQENQFLRHRLAIFGLFWRFRPKQQKCPSWKKCSLKVNTCWKNSSNRLTLLSSCGPTILVAIGDFCFFQKDTIFLFYYFKTQNSMLFRTNISWAFLHTTEALMLQVSGSAGKVTPGFIPHYTNLSSLWKIL